MQVLIEMFFWFWEYLAEILLIEKILSLFGVQPDKNGKRGTYLAHIVQIVLVLLIMYLLIVFYLTFIKYGHILI